jgi:TonB family protein
MHRSSWRITALLFMISGMTVSSASGSAKPMQGAEQQGTSANTGGQEAATPPSRPNPDASGVYHTGDGVSPPQLTYSVDPEFSDKARRKKLGGTCILGLVVDSRGVPQDVHITRSLAEGVPPKLHSAAQSLDAKAVEAVKQYKFKPAMYQGRAVPYETTVEITFRIY